MLPPDLNALRRAPPAEYRLQESGQIIRDPDFLTTSANSDVVHFYEDSEGIED